MSAQLLTRFTFVAFLLSIGCTADAKTKLSDSATIASSYDKATQTLTVSVQLVDGVHAYAPGETTGRPVYLVVSPSNGWKIAGAVEVPKGKEKTLRSSGKSMILEGSFALKAKVQGGQGPISGELHLQVCSDDGCDRPRVHPFTVEVPKSK